MCSMGRASGPAPEPRRELGAPAKLAGSLSCIKSVGKTISLAS
jgi:hypothetical protein